MFGEFDPTRGRDMEAIGRRVTEYYEKLSQDTGEIPPDETKTHILRNLIQKEEPISNDKE